MRFAFKAAVRLGLAVFLAGVVTGAGAAEKEKQAEKLPGAAEVLERYTKAIGGKETFLKHKSQQASGTVQMPAQGMNGKLDVYALRPNKMLIKMSLPGIGDLNTAYNGSAGWIHSQLTGAMMMEGKMLEQMAAQADFDQALRNPADYKTLEVLGAEEFEGEDCFKLKLVHKTGFETTEFSLTKWIVTSSSSTVIQSLMLR